MAGPRHALTLKSEGQRSRSQGMKCAAGVGMHVDTTASVSSCSNPHILQLRPAARTRGVSQPSEQYACRDTPAPRRMAVKPLEMKWSRGNLLFICFTQQMGTPDGLLGLCACAYVLSLFDINYNDRKYSSRDISTQ